MSAQQMLLLATCFYLAVLAAVTFFTRAPKRRFLGALVGGLAVAVVGIGIGIEVLLQTLGFWHYRSAEQPYGPLLMYPVVVLMWAVLPLIDWRVMRRFGWRGLAVFLTSVTIVGTVRDYFLADQTLGFISLSPGSLTALVDAACWAGTTALAQVVIRLVAGPVCDDRLSRRPWEVA
jgi:hypothetical protein